MNTDNKRFKYKEITYQILNAAFEVHNILGCGFLEKVYENSVVCELRLKGMKVEAQKKIEIFYKGKEVGIYVADLIIEDKVIVEVKAVDEISKIHKAQLLNYLKATGYEVGLILNFAKTKLEYERLVV
ncbi:MAG: GxxExxY protein [bacterium]